MPDLAVGGIAPLTSVDFPGRLAAVIFLQGCSWDCGYCHNPHLIPVRAGTSGGWDRVRELLLRRQGLLDGVVFSGGEPTQQDALAGALREVRSLSFQTGLHTSGAFPARLRGVLPLLDWVGLDVKTAFDDYAGITGSPSSGKKARESAVILLESGIDCEFRTTVHPLLHSPQSLLRLAEDLRALGARHWRLQGFRPEGCADATLKSSCSSALPDPALEKRLREMFETFDVRHA